MAKNANAATNGETVIKRGRKPANIPENETKNDRFKRVCGPRVVKALAAIQSIGKCANNNYEWSDEEFNKMKNALVNEVNNVLSRFENKGSVDNANSGNTAFF